MTAKPQTVAVVGSGMAGLAAAYLLHNDPRQRYRVKVLEKKDELSLNSESVSVYCEKQGKKVWADMPMRAIAGGFYRNLIRMYDFLGVRYRPQPFLFSFARLPPPALSEEWKCAPHMVHASNFHQVPPKPRASGAAAWLVEVAYVLLCYLWFSVCCFAVAPLERESFRQYLRRTALPQYYADHYLLPLMCAVCTCSHQQLLAFPAVDVLEYKSGTHRQQHYVVDDGVQVVQDKLSKGLDIQLGVCLTKVEPSSAGVELSWRRDDDGSEQRETFDRVVLAVSPDITAHIFEPLRLLKDIPTAPVSSIAHTDRSSVPILHSDMVLPTKGASSLVQNIHLRSDANETESVHEQSNDVIVTTNPITPIDPSKVIRASHFTRVLRTPDSRQMLNGIFADDLKADSKAWRNGDGGVYLCGGWCWDGMVLLEGCIVSAMRVASSLGVEIPWEQ